MMQAVMTQGGRSEVIATLENEECETLVTKWCNSMLREDEISSRYEAFTVSQADAQTPMRGVKLNDPAYDKARQFLRKASSSSCIIQVI